MILIVKFLRLDGNFQFFSFLSYFMKCEASPCMANRVLGGAGQGSELSVQALQGIKTLGSCPVCHSRKQLKVSSKKVDIFWFALRHEAQISVQRQNREVAPVIPSNSSKRWVDPRQGEV